MAAKISREYASALYALAMEAGEADAVRTALEQAVEQMEQQSDYIELLNSPGIPLKERLALLDAAFGGFPAVALDFIKLLCEKGHIREFGACAAEYAALMDEAHRVSIAHITSAKMLTDAEKKKLKDKLEALSGRSVTLLCRVDPALIGGMILEMDGKVTDGSLRSRLNELKEVIGG